MAMAAAAAAAVAANKSHRDSTISLGEVPKLPWVWVADQRAPSQPRKLPVPKNFQHGHEHAGKLNWESLQRWLSRGVERQVTSVWVAVERPGSTDWRLDQVPAQLDSSPFKDGTLIVVCCGDESLSPNLPELLPAPAKLRSRLSDAVLSGKVWKNARARLLASMALSKPTAIFGKRSSDGSESSLSRATRDTQSDQPVSSEGAEPAAASLLLLKPAIKKDGIKKKLRFEECDGGRGSPQQTLQEVLPPVSSDSQAADLNKPQTPSLLREPSVVLCGENLVSRGTQTVHPVKVPAKARPKHCCTACCSDEEVETEVWLAA